MGLKRTIQFLNPFPTRQPRAFDEAATQVRFDDWGRPYIGNTPIPPGVKTAKQLRDFFESQTQFIPDDTTPPPSPLTLPKPRRPIIPAEPVVPPGGVRLAPTMPVDVGLPPGEMVPAPPPATAAAPDLAMQPGQPGYTPPAQPEPDQDTSPVGNVAATYSGADATSELPTYRGLEAQANRVRQLENAPLPKLSRKRAALGGLLYGLSQGLATGNVAAGVGGGLAGLTAGAVAPHRQARIQREQEISKANAEFMRSAKRASVMGDIEASAAMAAERRAQPGLKRAEIIAQARKDDIARVVTMHGRAGHYDPTDPKDESSQQILAEAKRLGIEKQLTPYSKDAPAPHTTVVDGVTYQYNPKNNDWAEAKGVPKRLMVPGKYGPITPERKEAFERQEATAQALAGRTQFSQNLQTQQFEWQKTKDAEDAARRVEDRKS